MADYVYILGDYDEFGTENAVATSDRALLPLLLRRNWPRQSGKWIDEAASKLDELLARDDAALAAGGGCHGLHDGWGGALLYVLPLAAHRSQVQPAPRWFHLDLGIEPTATRDEIELAVETAKNRLAPATRLTMNYIKTSRDAALAFADALQALDDA